MLHNIFNHYMFSLQFVFFITVCFHQQNLQQKIQHNFFFFILVCINIFSSLLFSLLSLLSLILILSLLSHLSLLVLQSITNFQMLLLYSSKVNFFTKSTNRLTDRQADRPTNQQLAFLSGKPYYSWHNIIA